MTNAAPAFALLLRLCAEAAPNGTPDSATTAAAKVDDWNHFLRLIERHRVPGVAHAVLSRFSGHVPEAVRQAVSHKARAQAHRSLAMAAATVRLQQVFDQAGIDVVFFKGVALGQRAYGSLGVKHGKDIDFLVAPTDLERVFALLMREGYRLTYPRPPLTPARFRALRAMQIEAVLVNPRTGVQLEPHWRLTENSRLLPLAPLLAAAGKWESIAGTPIRSLHPDDHFVYLCVHGARSGWFRLKWLADLHALVAAAPPDELLRLHRHAEARRAGPSATLALGLCRDLFGLALPPVIAAATNSRLQRKMRGLCLTILADADPQLSPRRVFLLPMLHALAYGAGPARAELLRWTVNCQDALDVPLPRGLYFLYPALRLPLWIGRRLGMSTRTRGQVAAD